MPRPAAAKTMKSTGNGCNTAQPSTPPSKGPPHGVARSVAISPALYARIYGLPEETPLKSRTGWVNTSNMDNASRKTTIIKPYTTPIF